MVTTTPVRVPVTTPLRDLLRAATSITVLLGDGTGGIYAGDNLPKDATLPAINMRRVSPGGDFEQLDQTLFRFDIWATAPASVEAVEVALRTYLEALASKPLTPLTGASHRAVVLGVTAPPGVPVPDPDDSTPRVVVTANVTTKAVAYTP